VPYTVSADYINFNVDKKVVDCTGNVALTYQDIRIYADNMRIDVKFHVLEADGGVRLVTLAANGEEEAETTNSNDQTEEETEALRQEAEGAASGKRKVLHGDLLQMDLEFIHGMLLQTMGQVQRYWFQGVALDQSAPLANMRRAIFMDEGDFEEPFTSITARKMRMSPADKYEAWSASMYVKGGKALSLPYYTNDTGKVTPGNWRLRNVKYSSEDNFSFGVAVRYSERKNNKGFFNVVYKDAGPKHFGVGMDQQFALGKRTNGLFSMDNLGTDNGSMSLTLNRFTRSMKSHNLNLRYDNDGQENLNYTLSGRMGKSSFMGYVQGTWNNKTGYGMLNSNFSLRPPVKYLGKSRKLSHSLNYSLGYSDYQYGEPQTTAFVGMSLNRSGWAMGPKGSISANMGVGYGIDADGDDRNNMTTNLSYNYRFGKTSLFSTTYRYSRDQNATADVRTARYVSTAISFGPGLKWSTRLSTSYNIAHGEFSSIQGTLNYSFGKKVRIATTTNYDLKESTFSSNIYHMYYNFYGSSLNFHWYEESNNFIMDFISKSR
jgi:hypothetical protein